MQPIEGITPDALWTSFGVVLGLCSIVILFDKVADIFRKHKARKNDENAERDVTVKDQLAKIEKKLDGMDKFMQDTTEKLDRDNRRINALEKQAQDTHDGISALCRSSLAHINHDLTGNGVETLRKAQEEINKYLTGR